VLPAGTPVLVQSGHFLDPTVNVRGGLDAPALDSAGALARAAVLDVGVGAPDGGGASVQLAANLWSERGAALSGAEVWLVHAAIPIAALSATIADMIRRILVFIFLRSPRR
jgi:hypothetical protein